MGTCMFVHKYGRCSDACTNNGIKCGTSPVSAWRSRVILRSMIESIVIVAILFTAAMSL